MPRDSEEIYALIRSELAIDCRPMLILLSLEHLEFVDR